MINEDLWEFPHQANLKIMADATAELKAEVMRIFSDCSLCHDPENFTLKTSTKGTFISMTCSVTFEDKQQVEKVYQSFHESSIIKLFL